VSVNGVNNVIEAMSKRNREIFKLPTYMLYVTRAFSTLEGIGLSVDENYSILQECYPYLAKRLMTDNSPRAKAALRNMLTGSAAGKVYFKLSRCSDAPVFVVVMQNKTHKTIRKWLQSDFKAFAK
jgi:predicted unusual protein kinase regulating ubiquinone biosynthesis (AarF/ABC1/UbiB family)